MKFSHKEWMAKPVAYRVGHVEGYDVGERECYLLGFAGGPDYEAGFADGVAARAKDEADDAEYERQQALQPPEERD